MDSPQIALEVAAALDEQQIPYMLVGSFSSNVYGVPRSTRDADFVIQHPGLSFKQLMLKLGSRFVGDPQLRFEGVTGTTRQVIELADHTFKVELFRLTDDPFDQSRFARRVRRKVGAQDVWFPTAEDVVVQKLRWWSNGARPKDIEDAKQVISVQGSNLNWTYIEHWCDQHESREALDDIRRTAIFDLPESP